MIPSQVKELLLRSLEHERSAVLVWHVSILTRVCLALGIDPLRAHTRQRNRSSHG